MTQRLLIIWILFWAARSFAQAWESVRAPIYDRGLSDRMQPLMPSDNPALLAEMKAPFFTAQLGLTTLNQLAFAYSLPVSTHSGLGLVWASEGRNEMSFESAAQIEWEDRHQYLLLSNGSAIGKWSVGQQLYFHYRSKSARFFASLSSGQKPELLPEQALEVQYRLGLARSLTRSLDFALLSPPLIAFSRGAVKNRPPISRTIFWQEADEGSSWPQLALLWRPRTDLSVALSNRGRSDRSGWQIGLKQVVLHGIEVIVGYRPQDDSESGTGMNWLGGVNVHYRGLDLLIGFGEKRTARLCVAFTPEQRRDLVELQDMRQLLHRVYPYSGRRLSDTPLLEVKVTNREDKFVFLDIVIEEGVSPRQKETYRLLPKESRTLTVKLPKTILASAPGEHTLTLSLSAWQKGSQTITQPVMVELMDRHDWNGQAEDLLHFIEPHHASILNIAHQISDSCRVPQSLCLLRAAYAYLQRNMHYALDPRPFAGRQDRVQYASETVLLQKGDCEDLTVFFASLLQALGLQTALIDMLPPQEEGHIFIMVEDPRSLNDLIVAGENLQRYIIRRGNGGKTRAFLPLELTALMSDFEAAWQRGIEQYNLYGRDLQGLYKGWVKIVDLF